MICCIDREKNNIVAMILMNLILKICIVINILEIIEQFKLEFWNQEGLNVLNLLLIRIVSYICGGKMIQ